MKLEVKGQVFPRAWDVAKNVKKLRDERRVVNLGAGTVGFSVYEVELPVETKQDGLYYVTPDGVRLYWNHGDQYEIGYLISELDSDALAARHFKR
ncbi:MAG: hypothetical protein ACT4NX_09290 [Deltaproteobacteria bacterium]